MCFPLCCSIVLLSMQLAFDHPAIVDDDPGALFERAPVAGFQVAVDPDQLFSVGLTQSWRNVDQCHNKFRISGQPLSKVNYTLTPVQNDVGAVIEVKMSGSSVGESYRSNQKVKIVTDSLTKFSATQLLHVSPSGIGFSQPDLKVTSNQSFNRTEASKGGKVTAMLANFTYKNFPRDVHRKSQPVAQTMVANRLQDSMLRLDQVFDSWGNNLMERRPNLVNLGWHFSSDSEKVYLSSFSESLPQNRSLPTKKPPILISIDENYINDQLRSTLACKSFDSDQIRKLSLTPNSPTTNVSASHDEKPWSVTFGDHPVKIEFQSNVVKITVALTEFKTEERNIVGTEIQLKYSIHQDRDGWSLKRHGKIGIQSKESGARQRIVQSVIRKRLEGLWPESIPFPEIENNPAMKQLDLDLGISNVTAAENAVFIHIDHK